MKARILILIISVFFLTGLSVPQEQNWNFSSFKEYVDIRFDALDKAINKADIATEKRFEGVNEFRLQLSDQSRTFMPRSESESKFSSINERILNLETDLDKIKASKEGGSIVYSYIVSIISMIIALGSLIIIIFKRVVKH